MSKIKDAVLFKIYSGQGRSALFLRILLSDGRLVGSSAVLAAEDAATAYDLAAEKLQADLKPFLLDLELDDGAPDLADRWLADLTCQPLALAASVAVNRVVALLSERPLFRQFNQVYGLTEDLFGLPTPLINMFNGGRHADTNLDWEEFLLVPLSKNQTSFAEKIAAASLVFHHLADKLRQHGFDTDLGGFGGFAPDVTSSVRAVELIVEATQAAGQDWGRTFGLGLDIGGAALAAGRGQYLFELEQNRLQSADLVNLYEEWQRQYHLIYLEDPLAPADLTGWRRLTVDENYKLLIAGDKIFDNSEVKFRQQLKNHLANAIVISPGSLHTVNQTVDLMKLAVEHHYQTVLASGDEETNDDWLSDLAVAANADYLKAGAVARGERVGKINRLIEIEQDLAA